MPQLFTPRLGLLGCSLLIGLLATAELARCDEPPAKATEHVRLIIDYSDGVQKHYTELPWRPEMTVLDALRQAQQHPRGIRLEYRGKAATAMVTRIDDLTNQGGRGRNWIYRVNEEPGSRSCGIRPLEAGDTVLWKFETYR